MAVALENRRFANLCISGTRYGQSLLQLSGRSRPAIETEEITFETGDIAKHPQYDKLEARLSSFHGWDLPVLRPFDLANAGFYYTSIKDYVICFSCGGGIRDWDIGDNPWTEHEKWYPDCAYLKQCQSVARQRNQADHATTLQLSLGLSHTNSSWRAEDERHTGVTNRLAIGNSHSEDEVLVSNAIRVSTNDRQLQTHSTQKTTSVSKSTKTSDSPALTSETRKLEEENRQLREEKLCKLCLDEDVCVVFLPCCHMVACVQCSKALKNCPVCRANVIDKKRVFVA